MSEDRAGCSRPAGEGTSRPVDDPRGGGGPSATPSLAEGDRLGRYEIVGAAGKGGMGEVYRARDTRLDRIVAVKVLPRELASSPERRQRLEREARAVSQLSHPSICALHDVGHDGGVDFLVMEFLDGDTLARRLERGRLPVRQAVEVAAEIAGALDAAHRCGIVHRDLKPGNVILTRAGAKLLDFGIARVDDVPEVAEARTAAETEAAPLTGERTLVGTPRYMAPEQLEGRRADARSDIWSLGLLIHEMVTGRPAFDERSGAGLAAAILTREPPPMRSVAPDAPADLERVVSRCLAKDPEDRWQSARDVGHELSWMRDPGPSPGDAAAPAVGRGGRERLVWAAVTLALGIALHAAFVRPYRPDAPLRPARFSVELPAPVAVVSARASPDGRYLSFTAYSEGQTGIWLRPIDGWEARRLAGTEGARWYHFWSPDSRSIAFFADGDLKRVDVRGGPPQVLSSRPGTGPIQGGTWSADGTILFDVMEVAGEDGLYRTSAAGGTATRVALVDDAGLELQALFPSFLPDGRRFLFVAMRRGGGDFTPGGVHVASLDGGRATKLMNDASYAECAEPGQLLYVKDGALLARPFDTSRLRLEGEPTPVAYGVEMFAGIGVPNFSVTSSGLLAYTAAGTRASRLVWRDRSGHELGTVSGPADYGELALSPDERRLIVSIYDPVTSTSDLWLCELDRDVVTRFTSDARSVMSPAWAPAGRRIAFSMPRGAPPFLFVQSLDGGGAEVLLPSVGRNQWPWDWSDDGRLLVYGDRHPETNWDIWALPVDGSGEARPVLRTRFRELDAALAPGGRWMAFVSDESGDEEVYVQPFPGPGEKHRVSTGGAGQPTWRADGKELFYVNGDDALVATPVRLGETVQLGAPTVLFRAEGLIDYDVTGDGARFLVNAPSAEASASGPTARVLLDWSVPRR